MTDLPRDFDRDGLLEYSVVFTDRSLNHMSQRFQQVMRDISSNLKQVYNAHCVAVVPGGGSFGMEAVARQFATDQHCLVIRNGFFSFRWSQIFDMGGIPSKETVLKAAPVSDQPRAPFAPAPIETVVATIKAEKPGLVFAPHVETASGIILPDDYLKQVAEAVHSVGGLFVLDCIASGAIWVDMKAIGVDVLISAPQKGWSASPCSALVMMSEAAEQRLQVTTSTSFAADLKKWRDIMIAYEKGGHAYHATMPTDALRGFRDAMLETLGEGLTAVKERQWKLGMAVRELLAEQGYESVAAPGFEAPGVVVSYTDNDAIKSGAAFVQLGLQTAGGVPLMCDEPADFKTFRVGLFGLDKLGDTDAAVARLKQALAQIK
ncbi:class V aminotransferase [Alcanivorax sp. P2S70]|uniref:Alanine--glyoxylate aminotransferase family protein n=1 Tax=Alcanivorax profundi TaxID=2338368 RepID=A0A418XXD4_9GAMM|nr:MULTISPECIES: aminotransferase class V-fold PLP-dependent enzyme [Alcanivorax]ERP86753.1 class V aminotransferase [Alcanivorax sp. P2S70]RJG17506.1 alanine--glyoxylate aminotransferase family protein [Alcanivorax profundi]